MATFFGPARPSTEVTPRGGTFELPILHVRDHTFGLFTAALPTPAGRLERGAEVPAP
jgi:hypothetical protein